VAAPYSVRLLAKHDAVLGDEATYTVPPGKVVIVRDIDLYSGQILGNTALVVQQLSPEVVFFQASWGVDELGWRSWRGRQVLYAGDTLVAWGNRVLDVIASGYLLDA